jgi:hypothetical protein
VSSAHQYNPPNPARAKHPKPFVHQHGVGHHTAATRTILANAVGGIVKHVIGGGGKQRRRKATSSASAAAPRRRRRSPRSAGAHLVKGSSAAKAHMASLRKMRKGGKRKKKAA